MYWGCTKAEGGDGGVRCTPSCLLTRLPGWALDGLRDTTEHVCGCLHCRAHVRTARATQSRQPHPVLPAQTLTALTWMSGDLYQQPGSSFRDSILVKALLWEPALVSGYHAHAASCRQQLTDGRHAGLQSRCAAVHSEQAWAMSARRLCAQAVASSRGHIYIMSRAQSRVMACLSGAHRSLPLMDWQCGPGPQDLLTLKAALLQTAVSCPGVRLQASIVLRCGQVTQSLRCICRRSDAAVATPETFCIPGNDCSTPPGAGVAGPVVQMDAASERAPVLATLDAAGGVQVWDALAETCKGRLDADATCLVSLRHTEHALRVVHLSMWCYCSSAAIGQAHLCFAWAVLHPACCSGVCQGARVPQPLLALQLSRRGEQPCVLGQAVLPDGQHLLTGDAEGRLSLWDLRPDALTAGQEPAPQVSRPCSPLKASQQPCAGRGQEWRPTAAWSRPACLRRPELCLVPLELLQSQRWGLRAEPATAAQVLDWEQWPHGCALDCLRLVQQGARLVLATKSEDGLVATWDLARGELLQRWRVRPAVPCCWHSRWFRCRPQRWAPTHTLSPCSLVSGCVHEPMACRASCLCHGAIRNRGPRVHK